MAPHGVGARPYDRGMTSEHLGVVVRRPAHDVYRIARDPDELPRWAAGLAHGEVRRDGEALVVDSPMGTVRVVFAPPNPYGVLDHDVTLPTGEVTTNPLRVLPHPDGAEVVFTLRRGDATDEAYAADRAAVVADLERLRALLEG